MAIILTDCAGILKCFLMSSIMLTLLKAKPYTSRFNLVVVIILYAVAGISSTNSSSKTSSLFGTTPPSVLDIHSFAPKYKTEIARARCQARCNMQYGIKKLGTISGFDDLYRPFICGRDHSVCQECSRQCKVEMMRGRNCSEYCTTEVCLESCYFLNRTMHEAAENPGIQLVSASHLPTHSKVITLTTPVPACLYTPTSQEPDAGSSTVVLKWNTLGSNGHVAPYPLSFVVEMKEKKENGEAKNWKILGFTNFTVIPIVELNSSSMYKFRVSAVGQEGLMTLPKSSEWIRLPPAMFPIAPQNVSIVRQYVRGHALKAEIQWTVPNNFACYFKLYWMTPKEGSFHSQELREWVGFKYELSNLAFDGEYKLEIQTYDRNFQTASEKVTVDFNTPSCLLSTNYNYYSCSPEEPVDLKFDISEPFEVNMSMVTNVTLKWKPPIHVSFYNSIKRYKLAWRKTPDIRYMKIIKPDRGEIYLNGDTTQWTLVNIHWNSKYVVNIAAESKGGLGEKATVQFVTGDGYLPLLAEESNMTDMGKPSNKMYYVAFIPTISVVAIAAFCVFYCVKLRKGFHHFDHESSRKEEINPLYEIAPPPHDTERDPLLPSDKYEVAYSCLRFIETLGEGAFGIVLKAEFTPPNTNEEQSTVPKSVAVKLLKEHATPEEKRSLLLEISTLKFLGDHPHVVSIIACVTNVDRPCLIMDYCPLGDLRTYLCKNRNELQSPRKQTDSTISSSYTNSTSMTGVTLPSNDMSSSSSDISKKMEQMNLDSAEILTQTMLLSYARQIALGMEFLNQHRFIHRDLATRNVLMSSHKLVKISDFGLSRDVYETNIYQPTSGRRLPYKWMPLESIFDQIFTIKSDVWSYGILLWEIVTLGGCPYPGIPNTDLFRLLKEGYRLEKPSNCSTDIYKIMLSCWHPKPESRPSFTQLRKKMESLLEATCSYIDLTSGMEDTVNTSYGHGSEESGSLRNVFSTNSNQSFAANVPVLQNGDVREITTSASSS